MATAIDWELSECLDRLNGILDSMTTPVLKFRRLNGLDDVKTTQDGAVYFQVWIEHRIGLRRAGAHMLVFLEMLLGTTDDALRTALLGVCERNRQSLNDQA